MSQPMPWNQHDMRQIYPEMHNNREVAAMEFAVSPTEIDAGVPRNYAVRFLVIISCDLGKLCKLEVFL